MLAADFWSDQISARKLIDKLNFERKILTDFSNLEKSQLELEQVLQSRFGSNIKMENQHQEYKEYREHNQYQY